MVLGELSGEWIFFWIREKFRVIGPLYSFRVIGPLYSFRVIGPLYSFRVSGIFWVGGRTKIY